ncbi:MAG: alpha/beta hydrolase family protein [Flavobacterium sp.]|uniref:alpha/beta hydrolase n=1 Tax=Flavobacterium sp. TaxID=239 RepID=UPI0022C67CF4|nr:alpha/beta hydrolase family protein [Flavobacterium sp.]MCZ8198587.1 alpha/beta hydrolase family protein [Flavobacterium sp.]
MKKYFLTVVFFLLLTNFMFAAKVDTLQIASKAMNKNYYAAVVTPNSYAKSKSNFPVLYLLHGAYGHFNDWLKKTPNKNVVKDLADQYNIIIVMPEGETFSFYIDSPVNKESQFETYITQEVIQKIDGTYRTIANKNGRVITGLSMGGHGALYLSSKHPELFCAAGSMSGAVDLNYMLTPEGIERTKTLFGPILGDEVLSPAAYKRYAVMDKIDTIKENKLPLYIDCGVDDFLIENNRELHRRLVYNKIQHEYTERPGAHTWEYWDNALPYHILFFSKVLKSNGSM